MGYLRNLKVDKFFRVYKQRKRSRYLTMIYDIMMKPVHDVNLNNHSKGYLKTKFKARLSILMFAVLLEEMKRKVTRKNQCLQFY